MALVEEKSLSPCIIFSYHLTSKASEHDFYRARLHSYKCLSKVIQTGLNPTLLLPHFQVSPGLQVLNYFPTSLTSACQVADPPNPLFVHRLLHTLAPWVFSAAVTALPVRWPPPWGPAVKTLRRCHPSVSPEPKKNTSCSSLALNRLRPLKT